VLYCMILSTVCCFGVIINITWNCWLYELTTVTCLMVRRCII